MCGIVGYLGHRQAYNILISGLHRLEYRGYDSAGVAVVNDDGSLEVCKAKGKVSNLEQAAAGVNLTGHLGIAHTRWATHGEPNNINAHPHLSQDGTLALVHNGTIENYAVIKQMLLDNGVEFTSETDTEVLVQFIAYIRNENGCTLFEAVTSALRQVEGAFAIGLIEVNNPDTLIVARKASPLVIGLGDGETFIASDATPIVGYTDKVIYLKDNEIALIKRDEELQILDLTDFHKSDIDIQEIKLSLAQLEKGGYDTFMLKEIFEQPTTLRDCLRGRIVEESSRIKLSGVELNRDVFAKCKRIVLVACGTSWHAALIGKRLLQDFCNLPVEVEYASEFRYSNPYLTPDDVVIAISQSGETADTLAAIQLARQKGAFVYGVCNVVGASIPRNTDSGTYIHVGPEIG
ncbi:MAG: glutamine--fructose-6-phosphate transaminase (isomerizing), partial [Duncaniella sp.]|nr:glutamine--fructose-6-phosphate transaminase (isomerizing) [Duncaniella sp.]